MYGCVCLVYVNIERLQKEYLECPYSGLEYVKTNCWAYLLHR